jgi:hypothetical protein
LKVVTGGMKITLEQHAGVEAQAARETEPNRRLDAWILLIGIVSFLAAFAMREFLTRMDVVEIVTNRA